MELRDVGGQMQAQLESLRNFKSRMLTLCLIWIVSLIIHLKFLCRNRNNLFTLFVLKVLCLYTWSEEDKLYYQTLIETSTKVDKFDVEFGSLKIL